MKWPIRSRLARKPASARSRRVFAPLAAEVEILEVRLVLSAAFDVTDLTTLRSLPEFADIDGEAPDAMKIGIAIIDSGVFGAHMDLASNFIAFFDAVARDANADGIITPALSESPGGSFDPNGHGTHVSGTAASSNPDIGVATGAGLIGIRGLPGPGESFPQHDTLLSALQWVEENHQRYNIKVVNMSIQNGTNLNTIPNANDFSRQIDALESLGITVVSASGNAYADFMTLGASFPAVYSSLSVANTWEDSGEGDQLPALGAGPRPQFVSIDQAPVADQIAGSSQRSLFGNQVAAPGSTIFSTWNDGGYNTISGTSMASPFVTGLVALVQDAAITFGGRYLSVEEVVSIIRESADTILDTQNPNTQRAPLIRDPDGSVRLGTIEDLLETGQSFLRVNALNAILQTQQLFGQDENPNTSNDANSTRSSAIEVPPLNGMQAFSVTGNIGTDGTIFIGPNDVDLFRISVESPGQLHVETGPVEGGDDVDLYLRIFDADGNEIAAQNDAGANPYPDLTTGVLEPGIYYVGFSSFANTSYDPNNPNSASGGTDTGDYEFTVSLSNPDPDGVAQGAMPVDLTSPNAPNPNPLLEDEGVYVTNRFLDQEIGFDEDPFAGGGSLVPHIDLVDLNIGSTDVDFFRIIAPDTGTLFIQTDTSAHGTDGVDTFIRVYTRDDDGDLVFVAENDDASGTDSFLAIDITIGQPVFIAVASSGNQTFLPEDPFDRSSTTNDTGRYDLYLSYTNGDLNGTAFGAVDFEPFDLDDDGIINGVIGSDFGQPLSGANFGFKDVDFFLYTASQDGLLDISVLPQTGTLDPLDGVIGVWELNPTETDIVQVVDTSGLLPRTIVEVAAGQTMWISVTGLGNQGFNWAAPGSGTGGDIGEYRLSVQERPLSDLSLLTNNSITQHSPTSIGLGELITETIGTDNETLVGTADVDIFRYTPTVNQIVRIRAFADQEDSADTFLRIFDAQGQELAFNNDANTQTKGSEITILLSAGVTYYIGVNGNGDGARNYNALTGESAEAGSTGEYSLLITELPPPIYAAGVDAGGGPHVRVFDARTNAELASFFAYSPTFDGGVRVAVGDVTGDGVDDVVTVPGPGGGPHVRVLDGATLQFRAEARYNFMAFQPGMTMGLFVAVGDVNNDGFGDIIVTPDANSSPAVMVFSGQDGTVLHSFFAYALGVTSGVRVASGDVNGDGFDDILTVPGRGFPAHVRVFDGELAQSGIGRDLSETEGERIGSFFALMGFGGGSYIASGDVDGDGLADAIVGAGPGGGPAVQVFRSSNQGAFLIQSFFAYDPAFGGGVRVGVSEVQIDNRAEIITAPGPGGGPHVRLFNGAQAGQDVSNLFPFGGFPGGVFVAGTGSYKFTGDAQSLAQGFEGRGPSANSLTLKEAETLRNAAITRFALSGLDAEQSARLNETKISLSDLPGNLLGLAVNGTILLDLTASGAGWFIDPTPFADEEFAGTPDGLLTAVTTPAQNGVDLLSVILHELAHHLGGEDVDAQSFPNHLLADSITPGQRRLPELSSLDQLFAEEDLFANLLEPVNE